MNHSQSINSGEPLKKEQEMQLGRTWSSWLIGRVLGIGVPFDDFIEHSLLLSRQLFSIPQSLGVHDVQYLKSDRLPKTNKIRHGAIIIQI